MSVIAVRLRRLSWEKAWEKIYPAVLSLVVAFVIGGLLLLISGRDPIAAYQSMFSGAFGSVEHFAETLARMTPFLILAISVSISFRAGIWNIGAEGQLILGAIASTWTALALSSLPAVVVLPVSLIAAAIGGAFWSGLAGVLKAYFNANEVITTSMLNFVAVYLLAFLVNGPMKDPEGFNFPQSALINSSFELPRIISGGRLNIAFIVALLIALGAVVYWRSTIGFRAEIVGASRRVARHAGLNVKWTVILVTVISGALAGIAGWGEIFGLHFRLIEAIAIGMGSMAVVVALLGELHPAGMVVSAFLFAGLVVGGSAMERNAGVPFALVDVMQGIIILLIVARAYVFTRGKS